MSYDIGPRIGIEGEKEYRQAIQNINTNLRTLGTEMQAVTSQFDKNDKSVEALAGRNTVLNKQIDEQKNKLAELQKGLQASTEKYGENDRVTQGWQQSVNKATADLNNMERELRDNTKAMDEFGKETEDSSKSVEAAGPKFEKFGDILKGIGVAAGAAAAAAGAAAVKLGKEVLAGFADYEQLVGGVDTLFKESSQELQDYANNAYKTAGLSANDYMETVTGFSANLISSLGGDTKKSVKYADMAITDMSDNANKMGSDMSSIQSAYQGFAKQNYTMLDNLKLGYGGTKTEMERLLADAEKISGIEYDVSSYADIVDAIHIIQTEMGITGTTALEAEETISGSINALSSAWDNWLVGLGNTDADMNELTENLVDGFQTVLKNVVPIIENLASALPMAFDTILAAIGDLLPTLLDTAINVFEQVLDGIFKVLPELIPVAVAALMTVTDTLIDNLPLLIDAAFILITTLAQGVIEALPELTPKIVEVVIKIVETIGNNLPMIITSALQIILALSSGLLKAIPELVKAVPEIVKSIVSSFKEELPEMIKIGEEIVRGVWDGIKSMGKWIKDKVGDFFSGVVDGVKGVLGIQSPSKVFAGIGSYMAEGLGQGFENEMHNVARQINNSVPTSIDMQGQYQVSGMSQISNNDTLAQDRPVNITINLDGKVLARQLYDPLQGEGKIRGRLLTAGV